MLRHVYAAYALTAFALLAIVALLLILPVPWLSLRRRIARRFARIALAACGMRLAVTHPERLGPEPCIVVANHSSYLDGIVLYAALPPTFGFVIKREMSRVPLAAWLLRLIGAEFVERGGRGGKARDALRVMRLAARGHALVFFPEGTFTERRAVGKFHGGAFATAARNRMPVVALAVHGTREALPSGTLLMRRVPIRVQVLATFHAAAPQVDAGDIRQQARALIASAVGEPLAP